MPLEESYSEQLKSSIADMKNTGSRLGGAITAALFLKEFVKTDKVSGRPGAGMPACLPLACLQVQWCRLGITSPAPPAPMHTAPACLPARPAHPASPSCPALPHPAWLQVQWSHLDIAGPVWRDKDGGATGFGAQLLAEWVVGQGKAASGSS